MDTDKFLAAAKLISAKLAAKSIVFLSETQKALRAALLQFFTKYTGDGKTKSDFSTIYLGIKKLMKAFFNVERQSAYIREILPFLDDIQEATIKYTTTGVVSDAILFTARRSLLERTLYQLTKGIAVDMQKVFRKTAQIAATTDLSLAQITKELDERSGRVKQYATQIARDAVYGQQRAIQQEIAEQLGYNAYSYRGGLVDDSRPACEYIIKKLKRVLPIKDLPQIVATIKKSYPQGLYKNFGVKTFLSSCCGYNCRHILIPINV